MKRFLVSMVWALMLCSVSPGNEAFERANQFYEEGDFRNAADAYEALLKDEGPRVSVLNNLGSAYFRMEDHGRAILSFERALILSPGDPDLSANLKLAQDEATVFPESTATGWRGFFTNLSPDSRAVIALLMAALLPVLAFTMIRFRGRAWWAPVLFLLAAAVLKMTLRPLKYAVDPESRAVVLAKPATVRLSPFETAESRGTLSSGREVLLGEMKGGYYWIDTNHGATRGWVHADEVAPVIPAKERGLAVPEG